MGVDRETIVQVLVSVTAVAVFVAGLAVLTLTYGTSENGGVPTISPDGGLMLVGLIAIFIILMPMVGYVLEQMDFDSE